MRKKVLAFVTLFVLSILNMGSTTEEAHEISLFHERIHQQVTQRLPERYKEFANKITETLIHESMIAGIDPVLVMAIISTESSFNPAAMGRAGEIGLMQIRPTTAEAAAHKLGLHYSGEYELWSPTFNITFGIRYLSSLKLRFGGPELHFLSAYNLGSRAVRNLLKQNVEPQIYRARVANNYRLINHDIIKIERKRSAKAWKVAGP